MLKMKIFVLTLCFMVCVVAVASARTLNVGEGMTFQTIQSAIDVAQAGDVIEVAAGVYQESLFIKKSQLQINGAGAEQTIIESNSIVIRFSDIDSGRFSGFTVRATGEAMRPAVLMSNASALLSANIITGATTAGVDVLNSGNPTLLNNRIINNHGPGVLVQRKANVVLFSNDIEQNGLGSQRAGVEVRGSATAMLRYNRIWLNDGSGVFVHQAGEAQLIGNSIIGNSLHGVSVNTAAQVDLVSNSIVLNAQVGVRVKNNASATLNGNVISKNEVGLLTDTQLKISATDNIFFQNHKDSLGRGLSLEDANLSNTVLLHPQIASLFGLLFQLNDTIQSLAETPSANSHSEMVDYSQRLEFIYADLFLTEGLESIAQTRLNLAVSLAPESVLAQQAQS